MIVSQFAIRCYEPGIADYVWEEITYTLLLTNLAAEAYEFLLTLHVSKRPGWPRDSRAWCTVSGRDGETRLSPFQPIPSSQHTYRSYRTFRVYPHETVQVVLEAIEDPLAEIVGYVELTIPIVDRPQGDEPVKVLLHAWHATLRHGWKPSIQHNFQESDPYLDDEIKTTAAVTISTGKAENEIMPDQPSLMPPIKMDTAPKTRSSQPIHVEREHVKAASAAFERLLAEDPAKQQEMKERERWEKAEKARRDREFAATKPKTPSKKKRAKP